MRYVAANPASTVLIARDLIVSLNPYITADQGLDGRDPPCGGMAERLLWKRVKEKHSLQQVWLVRFDGHHQADQKEVLF